MTMPWMYYSGRDCPLEQKIEGMSRFAEDVIRPLAASAGADRVVDRERDVELAGRRHLEVVQPRHVRVEHGVLATVDLVHGGVELGVP